jgi:peptidyl-prolyl cis-trans isomerase B (cyclophilin B)
LRKIIILWVTIIFIFSLIPTINISAIETKNTIASTSHNENDNSTTDQEEEINRIAIIDTIYGIIKIELFERRAPITTSNFINLSIDGFYDGLLFHRVIDDFVIQTGDPYTKDNNPYNDGTGGSSKTIPLEIHPELTHVDGAVGMARSADLDSASSQFYICDGPQHGLDGDYAVFGIVYDGIDVVRKIAQVETWGYKRPILKDHPIDDIIMYSVFITENNSKFNYDPPKEEGDWLFGDSFRIPGFHTSLVITSIIIVILIMENRRRKK